MQAFVVYTLPGGNIIYSKVLSDSTLISNNPIDDTLQFLFVIRANCQNLSDDLDIEYLENISFDQSLVYYYRIPKYDLLSVIITDIQLKEDLSQYLLINLSNEFIETFENQFSDHKHNDAFNSTSFAQTGIQLRGFNPSLKKCLENSFIESFKQFYKGFECPNDLVFAVWTCENKKNENKDIQEKMELIETPRLIPANENTDVKNENATNKLSTTVNLLKKSFFSSKSNNFDYETLKIPIFFQICKNSINSQVIYKKNAIISLLKSLIQIYDYNLTSDVIFSFNFEKSQLIGKLTENMIFFSSNFQVSSIQFLSNDTISDLLSLQCLSLQFLDLELEFNRQVEL
eukprot:TRINITY_DN12299_c0_g1_i1.p1 TRINITY_DN12299_c0_g1~~TRINITY_DN12299_c0_g1_i1.p1  ORF type:complete len:357 (+),score=90.06 TRINITY_DN12299_c0_g1_i1:40-1071(+)